MQSLVMKISIATVAHFARCWLVKQFVERWQHKKICMNANSITNLIKKVMMTASGNESDFSEDILRKSVRQMYHEIVASFDPRGYILESLFAKGTITSTEKQQIEKMPERESAAALVDKLYSCLRPQAIAQFLEILSDDERTSCKWDFRWDSEKLLKKRLGLHSHDRSKMIEAQSQPWQQQMMIMEIFSDNVWNRSIQQL